MRRANRGEVARNPQIRESGGWRPGEIETATAGRSGRLAAMESISNGGAPRLAPSQGFVLAGGCGLAFGAAFANTGVFLRTGTSVSHLTGDLARLSIDLARWSPGVSGDLRRVAAAVFSFLLGALLAGVLVHHPTLDLERPYGRIIAGIGALLLAAHVLIPGAPAIGIGVAAFACGMQNGLAARFRGVVLRTTHVTGLVTDFGTTLGMRLRGFDIPLWKIAVPGLLTTAFFAGGMGACLAALAASLDPLPVAGFGYVAAGLGWSAYKHGVLPRRIRAD